MSSASDSGMSLFGSGKLICACTEKALKKQKMNMSRINRILALLAVLIGALMLYGGNVDVSGMGDLAEPWLGPFTKLEIGGFVFVGLIAGSVYWRMRKR